MPFTIDVTILNLEELSETKSGRPFPRLAVTYADKRSGQEKTTQIPMTTVQQSGIQLAPGMDVQFGLEKKGQFWNVTQINKPEEAISATKPTAKRSYQKKTSTKPQIDYAEKDKKIHVLAAINAAIAAMDAGIIDKKKETLESAARNMLTLHATLLKDYEELAKVPNKPKDNENFIIENMS